MERVHTHTTRARAPGNFGISHWHCAKTPPAAAHAHHMAGQPRQSTIKGLRPIPQAGAEPHCTHTTSVHADPSLSPCALHAPMCAAAPLTIRYAPRLCDYGCLRLSSPAALFAWTVALELQLACAGWLAGTSPHALKGLLLHTTAQPLAPAPCAAARALVRPEYLPSTMVSYR